MGFFGKVKENLQHGGVKIAITAPDQIEKGQLNVPVEVRLTASENRQINSVSVEIQRHYDNSGDSQRQPTGLGGASYPTPFSINSGQPLSLKFDVSIAPLDQGGDDHATLRAIGGALEKMNNAYDKASATQYRHYVDVTADVDGITIDPQASKSIKLDGLEASHFKFSVN